MESEQRAEYLETEQNGDHYGQEGGGNKSKCANLQLCRMNNSRDLTFSVRTIVNNLYTEILQGEHILGALTTKEVWKIMNSLICLTVVVISLCVCI